MTNKYTFFSIAALNLFASNQLMRQAIVAELGQGVVYTPECPHCHNTVINCHGETGIMQRCPCKSPVKTFNKLNRMHGLLSRLGHKKCRAYLHTMLGGKVRVVSATKKLVLNVSNIER